MLRSAIDTYYFWVVGRLRAMGAKALINGTLVNQSFGGYVQARDWPMTKPQEGALYLLAVRTTPTGGGTESQTEYRYFCQWTWYFIGSNISRTGQGEDRGDRYEGDAMLQENLRQANYPGFCQRYEYAIGDPTVGNLVATPSQSTVPLSLSETITWTRLKFAPRPDNDQSGLLYGAAGVEILAMSDIVSA